MSDNHSRLILDGEDSPRTDSRSNSENRNLVVLPLDDSTEFVQDGSILLPKSSPNRIEVPNRQLYVLGSSNGDDVRPAELTDIPYVLDLSKKEADSLGFIPKPAYTAAITGVKTGKRWSDVCNDRMWVCTNNGDLVGFVLASFGNFRSKDRRGKIAQICIQSDARKFERGRNLLAHVIAYGSSLGCHDFGCGCAEDLESNLFWTAMGWRHVGDRMGISHKNTWKQTSKRKVNLYQYDDPSVVRPSNLNNLLG